MPHRRRPKGTTISVPIGADVEYRRALEELRVLQRAPLGTDRTEGLQDLIEAILDYEAKCGRVDENGSNN